MNYSQIMPPPSPFASKSGGSWPPSSYGSAAPGPTSWKNWLTFGGDPVPDTDSGSLFYFPHHYGMGDFTFLSISHTVTGRFSRHSAKWLMNPQHTGSDPADIRIRIRINSEIPIVIPDHFWFALSGHSLFIYLFNTQKCSEIQSHAKHQTNTMNCRPNYNLIHHLR